MTLVDAGITTVIETGPERIVLPNALPQGYRIVGPDESSILDRLTRIEEKVDETFARVKKTNSLVGMIVGRSPKGKTS